MAMGFLLGIHGKSALLAFLASRFGGRSHGQVDEPRANSIICREVKTSLSQRGFLWGEQLCLIPNKLMRPGVARIMKPSGGTLMQTWPHGF